MKLKTGVERVKRGNQKEIKEEETPIVLSPGVKSQFTKLCMCPSLGDHLDCYNEVFGLLKGAVRKLPTKQVAEKEYAALSQEPTLNSASRCAHHPVSPNSASLDCCCCYPHFHTGEMYTAELHLYMLRGDQGEVTLPFSVVYSATPGDQHVLLRYLNMTLRNESVFNVKACSHRSEPDCNV